MIIVDAKNKNLVHCASFFKFNLLNKITPLLCVKKIVEQPFHFWKKKISHTIHLWRYLLKTNLKAAALFCWFYLLRVFTLLLLLGNKKQPILCQNIPPPKKSLFFCYPCNNHKVWKFNNFSATQILRESNLEPQKRPFGQC